MKGLCICSESEAKLRAAPYLPGLQEGQVLQDGQGHRWLLWGQQDHWALALQGLPAPEETGNQ
jgi:hypothetical protein